MESYCRFDIGNGYSIPFLEARWLELFYLKEELPDLYKYSSFKKVVAAAGMGGWVNGVWIWGNCGINLSVLSEPSLASDFESFRAFFDGRGACSEEGDDVV